MAILWLIPFEFLTPDFIKDRQTVFPLLKRPDYKTVRPSGVAELQSRLTFLENEVLKDGPYVGGDKLSVADIHVIWGIRWGLNDLGAKEEHGLGKDAFPKVWKLIESLPESKPETLSAEDAIEAIKNADYSVKAGNVAKDEPTGLSAGTFVSIESQE